MARCQDHGGGLVMAQILTGRNSVVAQRMVELLQAKIGDSNFFDPPLRGVSYGDQEKVPDVPWVCVEPNDKDREWPPQSTDVTVIQLEVVLLCYFTSEKGSEYTRL